MDHPQALLLFKIGSNVVLPGWLGLIFFPRNPKTYTVVKGGVGITALCYVASLILANRDIEGVNFNTLQGVKNIFKKGDDLLLNACWTHYLSFDLLAAAFVTKDAIKYGIPHYLVVPCILSILMLGPSGVLFYNIVKYAYTKKLLDI